MLSLNWVVWNVGDQTVALFWRDSFKCMQCKMKISSNWIALHEFNVRINHFFHQLMKGNLRLPS